MERFKWEIPDDSCLQEHIKTNDIITEQERLERYKFIWEEFGPPRDMLLAGGIPAMFALNEMKLTFMNGQFMATVLLAQVFIEHSLGSYFIFIGNEAIVSKGFAKLIDEVTDIGYISLELSQRLHKLRRMRNPYIHANVGLSSRSYMGRFLEQKSADPDTLVEHDAREAIQTVVDFLRFQAPEWNPNNLSFQEQEECK